MVLLWASFLLLPCAIKQIVGQLSHKDVDVYPLTIYGCDDADNILQLDVNLHNKNDQGEKIVDAELDLEDAFTKDWMLFLKADHWNNGDWDEHFYDVSDSMCALIQQHLPKVWKKLREKFSPPLSADCDVRPAHYDLTGFEVSEYDFQLPATMLGTFRFTVRLSDPSGTEMWCQIMEMEIVKK